MSILFTRYTFINKVCEELGKQCRTNRDYYKKPLRVRYDVWRAVHTSQHLTKQFAPDRELHIAQLNI